MRSMSENDNKRARSGYTMLEIMIVVGILTVIVTMAIPSLTRMKKHAYETAALEGMRALAEAEELYYEVSGYYTGGGNQIQDLRKVDAIDSGAFGARAGEGIFIRGYSIQFVNIGEYPQNYSVTAVPIVRGMNLRTFFLEGDGIVRNEFGDPM